MLLIGVFRSAPLDQVWSALRQVDPALFSVALIFAFLNLLVRGLRWAILFRPHHDVGNGPATEIAMVGLALNAVLPGRIGELVRIGLAVRRFGAGISFATTTVVVERLLDGLTLLALMGVSLLYLPPIQNDRSAEFLGHVVTGAMISALIRGLSIACLALTLFIVGLSRPRMRTWSVSILSGMPWIGSRLGPVSGRILEDAGRGLTGLRDPSSLARLIAYSILIWGSMAVANLLIAMSIPGISLTLLQALVLTALSVAIASIPSAPGAWGVFEAGALLSLLILEIQFEPAVGVAFVVAVHISQYFPVILSGVVAAAVGHISVRNIKDVR